MLLPNSLSEAKLRLSSALHVQKRLRNEIKELRKYIAFFESKPDLDKRNSEIFRKFKNGESVEELAIEYSLSKDRIDTICKRLAYKEKRDERN